MPEKDRKTAIGREPESKPSIYNKVNVAIPKRQVYQIWVWAGIVYGKGGAPVADLFIPFRHVDATG